MRFALLNDHNIKEPTLFWYLTQDDEGIHLCVKEENEITWSVFTVKCKSGTGYLHTLLGPSLGLALDEKERLRLQ